MRRAGGTEMDRRSFVRVSAGSLLVGTLGVQALIEACTPVPAPAAKPTSGGAGSGTAALPTYVPFKGPDPDLAGTIDGVQPAYFSYPRNPVRRYPQSPLKGLEVTGIVSTPTPPPIPM